jgi:hypothetical protein
LPWAAKSLTYGLGLPHPRGGPTYYRTQYSNTPCSHNSATVDVETGSKLIKHRGETLREDVDADLTDGNLLSDEIKINLHMLRALMLNGVGGEVHDADVVAVDESAARWRSLELMQELAQPGGLNHTIGDGTVLGFDAGAGDDSLPLGRPGCPRGTQHSPTWCDEYPGRQPSRRQCRRLGRSWTSDATASLSQASHEDSARCASWPSSGAPEGRACASRSATAHKRCRAM